MSVEDVNIFVKTLKKENVSVNYLLVKNEGHGFQKEENKFSFYRELESFFEENLMNR